MRVGAGILAVVAAAVLFAGCGGGDDADTFAGTVVEQKPLRKLAVTLDGYSGPENVGILMADWQSYFREAGLKVEVLSPARPNRPVEYTADGIADVGVSRQPEVAIAQSTGTPVVAIGSLVDEPTAAMIWLRDSGIKDVSDLKGRTIATAGLRFEEELLGSVLRGAGLSLSDVKVENVGYGLVPSLVKGRADAAFGGGWNLAGIQLEERGLDPVVTRVQDLGVPPYEEFVVIVRRDRLAKDPRLFRDFMAAVARGTATAIEDPDLAFEVVNEDVETDIRVTPEAREAQVDATLPLLSESGEMDPEQASELIDWMRSEGMIQKKIPVSSLLTNEYLPRP
jgi:putative hydroxymethylpyrimidine transport system substrate-binding protein